MSAITSKKVQPEAPKETKEPKAKASKAKKATQPKASKKGTQEAPKKGFPKSAGTNGKPGVIASIVELLQHATAKKPISKKELVEQLHSRFPDREATALKRTVNCQVPSRLATDKELEVQKNDDGYWLAK